MEMTAQVAAEVSLAGFGSCGDEAVRVAETATVPKSRSSTGRLKVETASAPSAMSRWTQVTVPGAEVQPAERSVAVLPAGSVAVTVTSVASSGPWLRALSVYDRAGTRTPNRGRAPRPTSRSASAGVLVTVMTGPSAVASPPFA